MRIPGAKSSSSAIDVRVMLLCAVSALCMYTSQIIYNYGWQMGVACCNVHSLLANTFRYVLTLSLSDRSLGDRKGCFAS